MKIIKTVTTVGVPHKRSTLEAVIRVLITPSFGVAFRKGKSIGRELVHLKDNITEEQTNNCLYELTCEKCPMVCIGETGRELQSRVAGHRIKTKK